MTTTTTLITDEDIAAAELAAQEAARDKQAVERTLAGAEYGSAVAERLTEAAARARHRAVAVTQMRLQQEQQRAALATRAAAAEETGPLVAELETKVTEARAATVAAFRAAEAAMTAAVRAADRYQQTLTEADAALCGRGLLATDALGEHETGGTGRGQVRVSGRWWVSVPAAALLARSFAVVVESVIDRRHVLAQLGRGHLRGYSAAQWSDVVQELDQPPVRVKR